MGSLNADPGLRMVRVLGPIDIVTDDGVVVPSGRIGRKLLGVLAISVNHMVSSDRLADILWGDKPPPSRNNTLQTYVFRLRSEIGHDRIASEGHSYSLRAEPQQLDALLFERMAGLATTIRRRPVNCVRVCKRALSLWRGVPFGEFADEDPFRLEAIRLDELRLFVMEVLLECELQLGHEELVVGNLEGLIEDYPYRERLWYLLIDALALSGRRVEALRTCRRLEGVLGELGLEPAEEVRQLEEAILADSEEARARLRPLSRSRPVGRGTPT